MPDTITASERSRVMSRIRGKDTTPELLVRTGLHRLGFRYRLHVRQLPGKPDLVFPRRHAVIFVHGCFWHGHTCHFFRWPSTRVDFWREKITKTRLADKRNIRALLNEGWRVLIIYECSMRIGPSYHPSAAVGEAARWLRSADPFRELAELRTSPPRMPKRSRRNIET